MDKIRALIVDDSSFSITILKEILEEKGVEVVGKAMNKEDAVKEALEKKPNLITMDMTLPDTDGIECTKAIMEVYKDAKVIVVSSMMDDEIVKKAKKAKISGYVQKPVDAEELYTLIDRVMGEAELYKILKETYFSAFKDALQGNLQRFMKTKVAFEDEVIADKRNRSSEGISIAIGIIGRHSGRMIIDMPQDMAENITLVVLGRKSEDMEQILAAVSEFTNIVAGNASSMLNRINRALGLRVSPPTMFHGKDLTISVTEMESCSVVAKTDIGDIFMNVGFKRGEDEWM